MTTVLWILTGWVIAVAAHVAGHVLCASLCRIPIQLICVGEGPVLLRGRIGNIQLEFRALPLAGFVVPDPFSPIPRGWRLLFALSGVLANSAVIYAAYRLKSGVASDLWFYHGLTPIAWTQVFVIIVNLIPCHSVDGRLPSDGGQLWQFLRGTVPEVPNKYYVLMLTNYSAGREPELSNATPRLIPHFPFSERWVNAEARHSARRALLEEIERREMSLDEELLVLDCLITDVLIFVDQAPDSTFRPQLDAWSKRALELGPEIFPIRATRGGVLIELGRYQEGKALTESAGDAIDDFDAIVRNTFLARAEHGLGNTEAAKKLLAAARRTLALVQSTTYGREHYAGVARFIDRMEREIDTGS